MTKSFVNYSGFLRIYLSITLQLFPHPIPVVTPSPDTWQLCPAQALFNKESRSNPNTQTRQYSNLRELIQKKRRKVWILSILFDDPKMNSKKNGFEVWPPHPLDKFHTFIFVCLDELPKAMLFTLCGPAYRLPNPIFISVLTGWDKHLIYYGLLGCPAKVPGGRGFFEKSDQVVSCGPP